MATLHVDSASLPREAASPRGIGALGGGRATVAGAAVVDGLVILDASARWHGGLDFLGKPAWWLVNGTALVVLSLFERRLERGATRGSVAAFLSLPLLAFSFMIASEGSATFDWRRAPLFAGIFEGDSYFFSFLASAGYVVALLGAVAHGVLFANHRWAVRRPSLDAPAWAGIALGSSAALISVMAVLPVIGSKGPSVEAMREWAWGAVCAAGAVLVALGVEDVRRRSRWLDRVRRGSVPGFAVVAATAADGASLACFQRLPAASTPRMLVRQGEAGQVAIALVP